MNTAFLSVDYDDSKQSSYKAILVDCEINGVKSIVRFDTGNPIVDYIDYLLWRGSDEVVNSFASVQYSSNFGHFLMDGNRYKEMYVRHYEEDGKDIFVAVSDEELYKMGFDTSGCTRYITRHPYTTFDALRKYYYKVKGITKDKQKS